MLWDAAGRVFQPQQPHHAAATLMMLRSAPPKPFIFTKRAPKKPRAAACAAEPSPRIIITPQSDEQREKDRKWFERLASTGPNPTIKK